jgi:hypothetical protein
VLILSSNAAKLVIVIVLSYNDCVHMLVQSYNFSDCTKNAQSIGYFRNLAINVTTEVLYTKMPNFI